jgi:mono/diheme cytochrome c family protein
MGHRKAEHPCHCHWAVLLLLAGSATGCSLPQDKERGSADPYAPQEVERSFVVLFERNCVGCHGADGKLGPAPPLNDKLFLSLIPDAELHRVVAEGRPGTLMPAFAAKSGGHLTAGEVEILVKGIRRQWGSPGPGPATSEPGPPPYLIAQARSDGAATATGNEEEGLKVFAQACASCHGDHGQGGRYDGNPVGAVNDTDFLALMSDQALRRYVITGRHDLGMPDYAGSTGRPEGFRPLTDRQVTSVVALLAEWRRFRSADEKGN